MGLAVLLFVAAVENVFVFEFDIVANGEEVFVVYKFVAQDVLRASGHCEVLIGVSICLNAYLYFSDIITFVE